MFVFVVMIKADAACVSKIKNASEMHRPGKLDFYKNDIDQPLPRHKFGKQYFQIRILRAFG